MECKFVEPPVTHASLAALSLSYLTFPCFDLDLDVAQRQTFVNNGDYAFQDYAVTHWSDHFAAAITDSTADPPAAALPGIQNDLVSALTNFVAAYGLTPDSSALEDYGRKSGIVHGMKLHSRFLDRSCYEDVLAILHLLQGQSAKGLDGLDEISPLPLDRAVHTSRAVLEGLASADAVALQQEERQKLVCFYGKNWFKCSKAACFYFHYHSH